MSMVSSKRNENYEFILIDTLTLRGISEKHKRLLDLKLLLGIVKEL